MDVKILDFLSSHRVSALTTMLSDGSPHAAALHYSHSVDPLKLYFSTENTSRKAEALINGGSVKASVVIGFSEDEWITLQMDGEIRAVLNKDELSYVQAIHYNKHPGSEQYKNAPETIFLEFIPTWWRYTDFNTHLKTILSSEKEN